MSGELHVPNRPAWDCRACGHVWPCDVAQRSLRREYAEDRVSTAIYVAAQFTAAARDLPDVPAGDLYAQMFSWLRG